MSYSFYPVGSSGHIFHILEQYVQGVSNVQVDSIVFKDSTTLKYFGRDFATIKERNSNGTPIFEFLDEHKDILTKSQFFKIPFVHFENQIDKLDKMKTLFGINYCVQEVRKKISFDQALYIKWVRDKQDGNLKTGMFYKKELKDRICASIRSSFHNDPPKSAIDNWDHIAFCTILSWED